ncbi:transcription factor FapR [Jonquetella anthropi]|uniref:transcription factor FapR n=1 Tax=Jonquetella anthropi TaxID=428712 RepID=UPI0001B9145A|nr:transcription factor FapR [Jonquetella anthropi]EEX48837.1 transcriptional regulator, DeoR family [Jonquetella anthropi E3_33 E1]
MTRVSSRAERHQKLLDLLRRSPLSTDEDLSELLNVSLSTVRLDRILLGVPEVRERARSMAEQAVSRLRSLRENEFIGRLLELEPNRFAVSELIAGAEMAFRHTDLIWDHYIYAQASALAIAVVEADWVIVGSARVRYRLPAKIGDRLIATARVGVHKMGKYIISVRTAVEGKEIFVGRFIAVAHDPQGLHHDGGETL